MIIICLIRSYKLAPLQELINHVPDWSFVEIERFNISGVPISRIALKCTEKPPPECDLAIEAIIEDNHYCPTCLENGKFFRLHKGNTTGYCSNHRENSPKRKNRKK